MDHSEIKVSGLRVAVYGTGDVEKDQAALLQLSVVFEPLGLNLAVDAGDLGKERFGVDVQAISGDDAGLDSLYGAAKEVVRAFKK